MKLVVGSDDRHPTVDAVVDWARSNGHDVTRLEPTEWPDAGRAVGEAVAGGSADLGVVLCWTGTGVSIAANKVPGVRAALCADAYLAAGARTWNDANVLALSMRTTSVPMVAEILDAFTTTDADPSEASNVAKLT